MAPGMDPRSEGSFEHLVRQALLVEVDGLPKLSPDIWQALVARIRLHRGLPDTGLRQGEGRTQPNLTSEEEQATPL